MIILSRAVAFSLLFVWLGVAGIFSASFSLAAEKIDINTAPLEDLVKIIHIGEKRALELISLRPFSSLDELTKIKGIGESRIQDIKKQGLAWVTTTESEKPAVKKPTAEVKIQQTYPAGVVINEILPSPVGPDAEEEWIEIFNQNNFEVDLSGWQITDTAGKTYTFPVGTKILAQGFLVLPRPTTKITLNNDGDGLLLIQPNGNILDSVNYQKAPQGQSYNRTLLENDSLMGQAASDWVWSNTLTPGSANIIPVPSSKIKDEEKNKEKPQKELAAVGEQFPKTFDSLHIFLIALGLAIFSGVIIFMLKKKLKNASNTD